MEPSGHDGFSPVWKDYNYNPEYDALSAAEKKHILGAQGCLWIESVTNVSKLQYMVLPRMLSLAETGWSALSQKNYNRFAKEALPVNLERFDKWGLNYRVPTVYTVAGTKKDFEDHCCYTRRSQERSDAD